MSHCPPVVRIPTPARTPAVRVPVLSAAPPTQTVLRGPPGPAGPPGPGGPPGPPGALPLLPPDAATVDYLLAIVGGVLTWVLGAGGGEPPVETGTGVLDFSDATNSGHLAALVVGLPPTVSPDGGALDFSDASNSGLVAAIGA